MYTIKEAAARTGIPIALLRAWERRYGVVSPTRTGAGYRLYDDHAVERLRTMRRLVGSGWQPSAAAAAILAGTAPATASGESAVATDSAEPAVARPESATQPGAESGLIAAVVDAAADLDTGRLERILDAMFAAGTFEHVADGLLLPALGAIGDAWADGHVSVAGEHAASHAILRRLAAAFQAAGREVRTEASILVGLPPGSRHELGALAFAVAARRAGLPIVYLGPDLPEEDWVAAARAGRPRAAVIGVPTVADVDAAVAVADALSRVRPHVRVAVGGHAADPVAARLAEASSGVRRVSRGRAPIVLPEQLTAAVDALRTGLGDGVGRGSPSA